MIVAPQDWPDLPGLHPFGLEDAEVYQQHLERDGSLISDQCLNSRIAWNGGFGYRCAVLEDCLVLISDGGMFTSPHAVCPIGAFDGPALNRIMEQLHESFTARGWPLCVMYIDEARLPVFESLTNWAVDLSYNRDFSDYVYAADRLRTMSGKALHGKRNHINRFLRDYPGFRCAPIGPEDQREAFVLVESWCRERKIDCDSYLESDLPAIRSLFRAMPRLDVRGAAIRVDGELIAFSLATLRQETAYIHFEKASADYPGLYTVITRYTLSDAIPEARWSNREEDMGLTGLRQAKESYDPLRLIHKYEALIRRPDAGGKA